MATADELREAFELGEMEAERDPAYGEGWFCDDPDEIVRRDGLYSVAAKAAAQAYKPPQERDTRLTGPAGIAATLVRDLSDEGRAVYKLEGVPGRRALIAFRGTATKADIGTDAVLALGQLQRTPRFAKERQAAETAVRALGPAVFAGHSLGGSLAGAIATEMGESPAYALNPGFPPGRPSKKLPTSVKVFRVRGDPVSAYAQESVEGKPVIVCARSFNLHGVGNFVP